MIFFHWFRQSVRNAVLGGVQDALAHLNLVAEKYEGEMVHTAIDQEAVASVKVFGGAAGPEQKRAKK